MYISNLDWLGFEFIEIRCEAALGVSAAEQAEDVFAQCRRWLANCGLTFENNVRSRI
jgi:enamine deaminase RidA (YjgF/YER057c/UK114 family)